VRATKRRRKQKLKRGWSPTSYNTPVVSPADIQMYMHALTVILYSTTVFAPGLLVVVAGMAWRNGIQLVPNRAELVASASAFPTCAPMFRPSIGADSRLPNKEAGLN
jgi:hypothetical protein